LVNALGGKLENETRKKRQQIEYILHLGTLSEKKGTKAVTGAVPFKKLHFCTQRLHFGTLVVHINT